MKIVLWGCGQHGHHIYNMIKQGIDEFEVIAFADTYCDKFNTDENHNDIIFKYGKILGYNDVKNLYESGIIDGVIVCILNNENCAVVYENLETMGVPVFKLTNNRISAADVAKNTYKLFNDRLNAFVVSNVDIITEPRYPMDKFPWVYVVKNNKVLYESDRGIFSYYNAYSFPTVYPIKKYDLVLNKACNLLFLGTAAHYGHFPFGIINHLYIMENTGFDGQYLLYDTPFAKKWMPLIQKFLNIDSSRIVYINHTYLNNIKVSELHCFQILGDTGKLSAEILSDFADKLFNFICKKNIDTNINYPQLLYIKRNGNYTRNLLAETEEIIKEYNFTTICPETLPIEKIIYYMSNAKVVITPHGSTVADLIFMQAGSHLIELCDAKFVDAFYFEACKCKKIHYRMLCSSNNWNYLKKENPFIHPELLRGTIEDVLELINKT